MVVTLFGKGAEITQGVVVGNSGFQKSLKVVVTVWTRLRMEREEGVV